MAQSLSYFPGAFERISDSSTSRHPGLTDPRPDRPTTDRMAKRFVANKNSKRLKSAITFSIALHLALIMMAPSFKVQALAGESDSPKRISLLVVSAPAQKKVTKITESVKPKMPPATKPIIKKNEAPAAIPAETQVIAKTKSANKPEKRKKVQQLPPKPAIKPVKKITIKKQEAKVVRKTIAKPVKTMSVRQKAQVQKNDSEEQSRVMAKTSDEPEPLIESKPLLIQQVRFLSPPKAPPYPRRAARFGHQGTVMVRVYLSAEGVITQTDVKTTSGHQSLDKAALKAVNSWVFEPATKNSVRVAAIADVPVHFRLK